MNGRVLTLSVSENDRVLDSRQVSVEGDRFSKTIRLTFPAGKEGTHRYVVVLSSETEELTLENNRYDLFIDVLKSK